MGGGAHGEKPSAMSPLNLALGSTGLGPAGPRNEPQAAQSRVGALGGSARGSCGAPCPRLFCVPIKNVQGHFRICFLCSKFSLASSTISDLLNL